jgi:hypothetical protein
MIDLALKSWHFKLPLRGSEGKTQSNVIKLVRAAFVLAVLSVKVVVLSVKLLKGRLVIPFFIGRGSSPENSRFLPEAEREPRGIAG